MYAISNQFINIMYKNHVYLVLLHLNATWALAVNYTVATPVSYTVKMH